ncbi:PEP-CTERM sorting domain-containing protein [Burkholderia sp. LMU1-1-1.1]|uniref:PEP-CTERM sorting domain-containing protein n=1 Tax=Burkholderia sp. LMU1-1-1.1 TaxID=3135266 RepID=UPI003429F5EE
MVSVQGSRTTPHSRSSRLRTGLRLIPLLCAAWAGNAAAIDVIYQGPPGSSGLTGAAPGAAGGNGMTAPSAFQVEFSSDLANTMAVTGGKGGDGGNGAPGNASVVGGNAGAGGDGALTFASLTATLLTGPASVTVAGTGGLGGNAGQPGAGGPATGLGATGGNGGDATARAALLTAANTPAQVAATATGGQGGIGSAGVASGNGGAATSNASAVSVGSAPLQLWSTATGGAGGAATSENAQAGAGGAASATNGLSLPGSGVPDLTMLTTATGGRGGDADLDFTLAPHANGGNGGAAAVNHTAAYAGNTLNLSQTATGGTGGATVFGVAGNGGNAASTISLSSGSASWVDVAGTAIGGQGGASVGSPFNGGSEWGAPGGGGSANSQLWLNASPAGWGAQITGTSTATAGQGGNGAFPPDGGSADAVSTVYGGGRVTSVANATGQYGAGTGGVGNAQAIAGSNYVAIARANAASGGAFFNAGSGAGASAVASASYFASADAVATSGSGRFGGMNASVASAQAIVTRVAGDASPPIPGQPSQARAHASAIGMGSLVEARSTYTDYGRGAAVTTRAANREPTMLYVPEATTAANVGGAAYGPWEPQDIGSAVFSYASALPTAASVAPLIASSAEVSTAFANADTLAAGTMAAAFFPMTASAELSLPFSAGNHLLLGLVRPFFSPGFDSSFSFSVSNGGTSLYSGSFTTLAQADAVFNGHALDLGVINANTLDLLLTFTLESGLYGFSYLVGQGGALAPVPEPGSWMLLMLGLALLGWRAGAFKSTRIGPAGV